MSYQNLEEFWDAHQQAIGKALPQGAEALAEVLQSGANAFALAQHVRDAAVEWKTKEGDILLMFCIVPDPGNLDHVLSILTLVRDKHPRLAAIFVHQWANPEGQLEAQFFFLHEAKDLGALIGMYQQIRQTGCPVSFVFLPSERAGLHDIYRLSARSYLEHHNQAKVRAGPKATVRRVSGTPTKELAGLRWVPRWASHVGCIKGCLNYLGINVSDAWLFGATGHAFVLNISPGLCPSGPTDWDTRRFLGLGRNLGYIVECVDEYCPRLDRDLREAQEKARHHIQEAIAQGLPC